MINANAAGVGRQAQALFALAQGCFSASALGDIDARRDEVGNFPVVVKIGASMKSITIKRFSPRRTVASTSGAPPRLSKALAMAVRSWRAASAEDHQ
ncbi:MAG: hypothetical protein R2867_10635 [Caldilineaceae bacterium]